MRIGILDSGVGGLTLLAEALRVLPHEDFYYYADTDHAPYGTKNHEQVLTYLLAAADFFAVREIKALVVACNTATGLGINTLRERYDFPVIGMEPAVKPALKHTWGRVLVTATALTLQTEKYHNLVASLHAEDIVDELPLPELVNYAEAGLFAEAAVLAYLRRQLAGRDPKLYGAVVLGCTHFPYFRAAFRRLFPPPTEIVDGNEGTVKHLRHTLGELELLQEQGGGDVSFFTSGRQDTEGRLASYLENFAMRVAGLDKKAE
jgi:glutamate racemase